MRELVDMLWLVEQISGLVVSADETDKLSLGYWPSFNVPFVSSPSQSSESRDFPSSARARA